MRSTVGKVYALVLVITLGVLAGIVTGRWQASGQSATLADQVVGTWIYVSVDTVQPNGSRSPMYGPHPSGVAMFDRTGRYILLTARPDVPKFAANNRTEGTPDEYKAAAQGAIAHFGRYTVNEADKTITFAIETSTFPNWNGVTQKRPVVISGDELRWTTPGASGGGTGEVVLRRAK